MTMTEDKFMTSSIIRRRQINHMTQQDYITLTICLFIALPTVSNLINISYNFIFSHFIWDTLILNGTVLMFSLRSIFLVGKSIKKDVVILIGLFLILYLLSFLFFSDNRFYMFTSVTDFMQNGFYRLFLYSMPLYFYLRQVTDYQLLFRYLSITAKIIVIAGILTYYVMYIFIGGFDLEYMVFAYDLLFGTIFCFYDYFQERKYFSLLLAVLGSTVIFIGGARGPLVCIVAYILLYIIFNVRHHKGRTLSFVTIISVFAVYISSNLMEVVTKMNVLLIGLGIQSRTIELILTQGFLNESGRDIIQAELIKYIGANPFLVHGMFGDRVVTQGIFDFQGSYAHNFIIEVLTQYGVILGLIFLCTVFLIIIGSLLRKQDPLYKNLVLLLIPSGLINDVRKLFERNVFLFVACSSGKCTHA